MLLNDPSSSLVSQLVQAFQERGEGVLTWKDGYWSHRFMSLGYRDCLMMICNHIDGTVLTP